MKLKDRNNREYTTYKVYNSFAESLLTDSEWFFTFKGKKYVIYKKKMARTYFYFKYEDVWYTLHKSCLDNLKNKEIIEIRVKNKTYAIEGVEK